MHATNDKGHLLLLVIIAHLDFFLNDNDKLGFGKAFYTFEESSAIIWPVLWFTVYFHFRNYFTFISINLEQGCIFFFFFFFPVTEIWRYICFLISKNKGHIWYSSTLLPVSYLFFRMESHFLSYGSAGPQLFASDFSNGVVSSDNSTDHTC